MAHFVLLTRDAGAWLVGPFGSAGAADLWGRETYCTPQDDPRWQVVFLANAAAPLDLIGLSETLPTALQPQAARHAEAASFAARATATLATARAGDSIVVALVSAEGAMMVHTRSDHPHHLAQVAANLAGEAAERLDMAGDVLDGAEQAGLLVACQDAETTLREALADG